VEGPALRVFTSSISPTSWAAECAAALRVFASILYKNFYGFEPDHLQYHLLRIVDDVVSVIRGAFEM